MSSADVETTDALGVVPTPMTGGDSTWLQFCTNAAAVRAAYSSSFGLKVKHATMNSVLYQGVFFLEGDARLKDIEAKEKAKGIFREEKTQSGKTSVVAYLSKEDRAAKKFQTLDETIDARSAAIGIPGHVMKKIDTFSRAWDDVKKAAKELHEIEDALSLGLTRLPVFAALQARAEQRKHEKDADDPATLKRLRDEGKASLRAAEMRLAEVKSAAEALGPRISALKSKNSQLDLDIKSKMAHDMEDAAIADMVTRRSNRAQIEHMDAEKISLDAVSEQVKREIEELKTQIKDYEQKIDQPGPSAKKQKL